MHFIPMFFFSYRLQTPAIVSTFIPISRHSPGCCFVVPAILILNKPLLQNPSYTSTYKHAPLRRARRVQQQSQLKRAAKEKKNLPSGCETALQTHFLAKLKAGGSGTNKSTDESCCKNRHETTRSQRRFTRPTLARRYPAN